MCPLGFLLSLSSLEEHAARVFSTLSLSERLAARLLTSGLVVLRCQLESFLSALIRCQLMQSVLTSL